MSDRAPIPEGLIAALQRRFGANTRIENVETPTLGGSSRTIVFDLVDGAARRRLVSREETYTAPNTPFLSPADQFRLMQIVHAHGFPVPEPIFEYDSADHMNRGYICAFVEGETLPKAILRSPAFANARAKFASQCGELLAFLHRMPIEEFAFLSSRADSQDALLAQRQRYDGYGGNRPALELGLRWLDRNRSPARPAVPLHGDFRLGNLMLSGEGIVAVLDWECMHLGSRVEDIGWLCTRAWRFDRPQFPVGGIDRAGPLLAAYSTASGTSLNADEVHYWTVFGLVRWAILNLMQASAHVDGTRRSPVFAACGRNVNLIEYDLLMTLKGRYH